MSVSSQSPQSRARPFRLPPFYPILDTVTAARRGVESVDAAEKILEAGATILQFRHKGFFSRQVFADLERIADLCRAANTLFVVNDRADLARLFSALHFNVALHLGQDDLPPVDARRIAGPGARIGFSTHNETQLRASASEPVDYLAIGPIFSTVTKENPDPEVGLDELRRRGRCPRVPLSRSAGSCAQRPLRCSPGSGSGPVISDLFPRRWRYSRPGGSGFLLGA